MPLIIIGILAIFLISLIFMFLWPVIIATLGALLAYFSFRYLRKARGWGEKILYGIFAVIGVLLILAHLKGILAVAVIAAIIYFFTKRKRPRKKDDSTFDYPYDK